MSTAAERRTAYGICVERIQHDCPNEHDNDLRLTHGVVAAIEAIVAAMYAASKVVDEAGVGNEKAPDDR